MKLTEYKPGKELKVLVKGDPGTRKSTSLRDLEGSIFWADWDNKIGMLAKHCQRDDIDYVSYKPTIESFEDFLNKMDSLSKGVNLPQNLVIDSLTSLADACIEYAVQCRETGNYSGNKETTKGRRVGKIEMLGYDEYGVESRVLTRILAVAKSLPINFILIAHVVTYDKMDVGSGKSSVSRRLVTAGNQLSAKIPSMFKEVWHFDYSIKGYRVFTTHSGIDYAMTEMDLPAEIDINDGAGIWSKIKPYLNAQRLKK